MHLKSYQWKLVIPLIHTASSRFTKLVTPNRLAMSCMTCTGLVATGLACPFCCLFEVLLFADFAFCLALLYTAKADVCPLETLISRPLTSSARLFALALTPNFVVLIVLPIVRKSEVSVYRKTSSCLKYSTLQSGSSICVTLLDTAASSRF